MDIFFKSKNNRESNQERKQKFNQNKANKIRAIGLQGQ